MYRVAIVEDDEASALLLEEYIQKYGAEKNIIFDIKSFGNALMFITDYQPNFDIVFMDIEMPHLNGIDASKILYSMDKKVCIIFVTNMIRYAVRGYEVEALDFIIKPVKYFSFSNKLEKAIEKIENRTKEKSIIITGNNGIARLKLSQVYYIEIIKHYLVYHTDIGEFTERGTISEKEVELKPYGFSRCSNGCLVNFKHISKIVQNTIFMSDNSELAISRQKREEFINNFMDYMRDF